MEGFDNNQNQNAFQSTPQTDYNQVYGQPVNGGGADPEKPNGLQIASLVVGIIAIVGGCCTGYVGLIAGIIGLVLAILGNKDHKHGIGTAGLVCSIIGIVIGVVILVLGVIGLSMIDSNPEFRELMEQYGYSF